MKIVSQKNFDIDKNMLKIGLLEYEPGDWNSDQTALTELLKFIKDNTNLPVISINRDVDLKMKIGSTEFYKTKLLYMTGHGEERENGYWQGIKIKQEEINHLRQHLLSGGFLHIDDNYNFDKTFFKEFKKVFPEKDWVELPYNHNIFNIIYEFNDGLPKIHKHDNKIPQALAMYHNKKIVALYTLEADLGDGWESDEEHERVTGTKLSPTKREDALKMGTNIIFFALTQ